MTVCPHQLVVEDQTIAKNESNSLLQMMRVEDVKVRIRLRASNEDNIRDIAESIKDIGLISPITVDTEGNLIAGFHRLQAHKLLGIKEIPVIISTQKDLKAKLQEIDENLKRSELNAIEKSVHIEERERILKQLDLLSVKGDNRYSAAGKSTQRERASEIGMSRRKYQYHKELENLHPEVRDLLNDTKFSTKLLDLVMLARESDEIQLAVTKALVTGKVHSIKRALIIEKTKINRIASPYIEGLPDFKERYGEIPKSIMHMGRPLEEGMRILWDLAANDEDLRTSKRKLFFETSPLRLYSWNPNHCSLLLDYYTRQGDTVLDPFVGRGSTAISAVLLKRNFIGIDLLPEIVKHNQSVLSDFVESSEVSWDFNSEDGIEMKSLIANNRVVDAVITDPPYYDQREVYSDQSEDLCQLSLDDYKIRIRTFFQNLRVVVRPSLLGATKRIHPVIIKLGSFRKGRSGLIDMALDFQIIAEECGWILWDKSFISLNSALQSLTFQRNYANGYLTKNYETVLVFVWFNDD